MDKTNAHTYVKQTLQNIKQELTVITRNGKKESDAEMKKYLWGIILLAMIVSVPFLWERVQVESANDTYEITVPYEDILELKRDIPEEVILEKLLDHGGIQSVALEPLRIMDLQSLDIIDNLNKLEFMRYSGLNYDELPEEDGVFLQMIKSEHHFLDHIKDVLNLELAKIDEQVSEMTVDGNDFLFVPGSSYNSIRFEPITFDMDAFDLLNEYDLDIVIRLGNNFSDDVDDHPLFDQIDEMAHLGNVNHLLFLGSEVVGESETEPGRIQAMAGRMNEWDTSVAMIENSNQKGLHELNSFLDRDPIRVISQTIGKGEEADPIHVSRSALAVQERNIQMLYINILNKSNWESYDLGEAESSLEAFSAEFLKGVHLKTDGQPGIAQPFEPLTQPQWMQWLVLIAAGAFTGLVAAKLDERLLLPIAIASTIFFLFISVINIDILMKLIVLGLATLAPIYAIFSIKPPQGWRDFLLQYGRALGISLTGAWFVVTLLYGADFLIHLDSFRGVVVLSVAPLAVVTLMLIGYQWLKEPVKFWHLAILAVVGGVIYYYVTRTGNAGVVLPYELEFRQWLGDTFGVRPRTTEFLIGFPLMTLGLYLMKESVKYAKLLLLFGALAFSSMVGTFTHLHTPLIVSIQRTITGLLIGIAVGFVLIGLWNVGKKYIYPLVKERLVK